MPSGDGGPERGDQGGAEGLSDAVETTRTLEDKATLAARSEADAAIGKARAAYDDAIEAAQKTYGETLDQSRGRAWDTIQKRLSIWNGELPEDLPPARLESSARRSLAAFERRGLVP